MSRTAVVAVLAYVYDELVDAVKPGDFMELTGIYRAAGVRVVPKARTLKSVYRTFIDVNSIRKDLLNRYLVSDLNAPGADGSPLFFRVWTLAADMDELQKELTEAQAEPARTAASMSPETIEEMKALGRDTDIYEKLVQSLAPNIWECDDVKKGKHAKFFFPTPPYIGLLCQLFGGASKIIGGRVTRSDIHILLCGDPSTAKSQLLQYVHGIAPR